MIGQDGWVLFGGSIADIASEAGHPGIKRITTSTIDESKAGIALQGHAGLVLPAENFWATFIFRFNSALDTSVVYRVGFADTPTSDPPANGIYVEKAVADTSWYAVTRASSTETRSALYKRNFATAAWDAASVTSTSWLRVTIFRRKTTEVGITVGDLPNGVCGSQHTTDIPTATLYPMFMVQNKTTTAKTLDVDLFQYHVIGISRD